jgi:hypothetical protein
MFDFKGLGYAKLTSDLPAVMADKFIDQATRQLAASGGRPVVWIFAEEEAALFVRNLFNLKAGFDRITIGYVRGPGPDSDDADKLSIFYTRALDRSRE